MVVGNPLRTILSSVSNSGTLIRRFPIREFGMNYQSQPLQRHEIEKMKDDPEIIQRIIISYELILDFYGFRLLDQETGLLDTVLPPKNAPSRFKHLNCAFLNVHS